MKPWLDGPYKKPYKPLGDATRDSLAKTPFGMLPEEEKAKDLVIANYLARTLRTK
jgi:hypothetical protein